jgi:hypothetical protein
MTVTTIHAPRPGASGWTVTSLSAQRALAWQGIGHAGFNGTLATPRRRKNPPTHQIKDNRRRYLKLKRNIGHRGVRPTSPPVMMAKTSIQDLPPTKIPQN